MTPRLDDMLPPDVYPILNLIGLIGILLVLAIGIGWIFVVVRDDKWPRPPRPRR